MTNLNEKTISEIADRSQTANDFFTYSACRERNVRNGVSRLQQIREQMKGEGFHPVPQDLLSMFRELERAGIGELRGEKFKWNVPIKTVGEIVAQPKPKEGHVKPTPKASKDLVICFGHGKEASVTFTTNLSKEEVEFLCEKILKGCSK